MLSARVLKQGSYAGGCLVLVIVALVFSGAAMVKSRPNPQPSATPENYLPLEIEQTDIIRHNNIVDAVVRLRNPNPYAGVSSLPIKFTFIGSKGDVLASKTETSYILPGNIQYVTALGIQVSGFVDKVNVEVASDIKFTDIPNKLELPTYNSFTYNRTIKKFGTTEMEEQRGITTNNSTFDFQRVEVTALAYDKNSHVVGVGTTFLGALKVNEQREFVIQWFKPPTQTERVIIFPTTNIFREENIIRVMGDPGLLR